MGVVLDDWCAGWHGPRGRNSPDSGDQDQRRPRAISSGAVARMLTIPLSTISRLVATSNRSKCRREPQLEPAEATCCVTDLFQLGGYIDRIVAGVPPATVRQTPTRPRSTGSRYPGRGRLCQRKSIPGPTGSRGTLTRVNTPELPSRRGLLQTDAHATLRPGAFSIDPTGCFRFIPSASQALTVGRTAACSRHPARHVHHA